MASSRGRAASAKGLGVPARPASRSSSRAVPDVVPGRAVRGRAPLTAASVASHARRVEAQSRTAASTASSSRRPEAQEPPTKRRRASSRGRAPVDEPLRPQPEPSRGRKRRCSPTPEPSVEPESDEDDFDEDEGEEEEGGESDEEEDDSDEQEYCTLCEEPLEERYLNYRQHRDCYLGFRAARRKIEKAGSKVKQ